MKDLIIIGAGGFGKEAAWLVERINAHLSQWNLIGFVDDDISKHSRLINGYKVLGGCEKIKDYPQAFVVCCIANTVVRKAIIEKISPYKNAFATLIDPAAIVCSKSKIGAGSVVCAGSVISVDIKIGSHNIIDVNSTVGHDATLFDYVTLYPSVNVSGNTVLGEGCEIGTGTQIIQGVKIGQRAIVGAGAVVNKDLPADCTAVGVPAKAIRFRGERQC